MRAPRHGLTGATPVCHAAGRMSTRERPPSRRAPTSRVARLLGAACVLLAVSACRAPTRAPFRFPAVELGTELRAGGLLTGADGASLDLPLDPADCLAVEVRWFVLGDLPDTPRARGLSGEAGLVVRVGGRRVLTPTPRLARDAVVWLPDPALADDDPLALPPEEVLLTLLPQDLGEVVPRPGALPRGATARFTLREPAGEARVAQGEPGTGLVGVLVHRAAGRGPAPGADAGTHPAPVDDEPEAGGTAAADAERVSVGLLVHGWLPPLLLATEDQPSGEPDDGGRSFREVVVLRDGVAVDGPPVTFVQPVEFATGRAAAVAAVVRVRRGDDSSAHRAAVARAETDLTLEETAGEVGAHAVFLGLTEAFVGLERAATRRPALAHLANRTGARLTEDLVLVGDDALVETLAARVLVALPSGPPSVALAPGGGPSSGEVEAALLGWQLERQALVLLSETLTADDPDVVLESVLLRRLGETGRHPSYVKRLADRVTGLAELDERLVAQNVAWLEDPAPSSRIRAHDWLARRGRVPAGYDPLGSRAERRAALEAYREAKARAGDGAPAGGAKVATPPSGGGAAR